MDKFTYRLDLTEDEFNLIKNNLNENILSKAKKIKVSEKKTDSMKRATFHRSEIARAKLFDAIFDLTEKDIEVTQYNLKKYKNIPYHTSKKYLDIFNELEKSSQENQEALTYTEEEIKELKIYHNQKEESFSLQEYDKELLKEWQEIKAKKKKWMFLVSVQIT